MNKLGPTYWAKIYLGLKRGYDGEITPKDVVFSYLNRYCEVGFGVNVQDTHFVYTGGDEPGLIIELINYPRFPSKPSEIQKHAFEIANDLKFLTGQERLSIVTPENTFLIEEDRMSLEGIKRCLPHLFSKDSEINFIKKGWEGVVIEFLMEFDNFYNSLKIDSYCKEKECGGPFRVRQIKEKFGELCLNIDGESETLNKLIRDFEFKASQTCELCGSKDDVKIQVVEKKLVSNICKMCAEKETLER